MRYRHGCVEGCMKSGFAKVNGLAWLKFQMKSTAKRIMIVYGDD